MTTPIVILAVDFKSREHLLLEDVLIQETIQNLIKDHMCFKNEQLLGFKNERFIGNGHNNNHQNSHNNYHNAHHHKGGKHRHFEKSPIQNKKYTSTERLERDILALLNKINASNKSVIFKTLLNLSTPTNVDKIAQTILVNSFNQHSYLDLFVDLINELSVQHNTVLVILEGFSSDFESVTKDILNTMQDIDQTQYDQFCSFGVYRSRLFSRQTLLLKFLDLNLIKSFESDSYFSYLTEMFKEYTSSNNQSLVFIIITLISDFTSFYQDCSKAIFLIDLMTSKQILGKKNEFTVQTLVHKLERHLSPASHS